MDDIYLLDLISGISNALDCVSSLVNGHHRRVGLSAFQISHAMGFPDDDVTDTLVAGLLHDIGAYSMQLKLDGLDFDADHNQHAINGHLLLKGHPMLERPAEMVRHHHTPWYAMPEASGYDKDTQVLANVINLADRVDILSHRGNLSYTPERISESLSRARDTVFHGPALDAFIDLSRTNGFWDMLDHAAGSVRDILGTRVQERRIPFRQLLAFSDFFATIIDFRSRHTATHSLGVAETATQLAKLAGMNERDQQRMRLAGNLHDIGKLAVPTPLLDKPAALDEAEYCQVQSHAGACEDILSAIPGLEEITTWACQHHERLDGSGYPHGLRGDQLSLGSRIMAVADVFTAITEDRPYRDGMSMDKVQETLRAMVDAGHLDPDLVNLLLENLEHVDAVRRMVQARAMSSFRRLRAREDRYFLSE